MLHRAYDMAHRLPGEFAWRQCTSCQLVFLSPRPDRASISAYYPGDYSSFRPSIASERSALMRWARRRNLAPYRRLIEAHASPPGPLLDVGCATGNFLAEMARHGWHASGIEPDPTAGAYAREQGLDIVCAALDEARLPPRSYAAVSMWHVLEHMHDPVASLRRVAGLLQPGGILAMALPNGDSLERSAFGHCWHGWDPPRHLFVFTHATLGRCVEEAGLLPIRSETAGAYYLAVRSLGHWLRARWPRATWVDAGERILRTPGVRFPFSPIFALVDAVGRGSELQLVARTAH